MLEQELKAVGLSATTVRVALLRTLRQEHVPTSAEELGQRLLAAGITIGRASLFRNLEAFTQAGFVERINDDKRGSRYIACSSDHDDHHHHIICRGCQQTAEVDVCLSSRELAAIERHTNFRITGHTLTLYGLCHRCNGQSVAPKHTPDGR